MADEIKIKLNIDDGDSLNTLNSLESKLDSLKDSIGGVAVGSEEFQKLSSEIAQTEATVKNLELSMEGLDMEQKASEFGSFAAGLADTATGALALSSAMGITNESSEQMIESLVSGMAVAQTFRGGLEGIVSMQKLLRSSTIAQTLATQGSTVAMRVFNAVTKANPIMILVGAVVAAVGAFALFSDETEEAEDNTEALNEAEQKLIATIKEQNRVYKTNIAFRKERRGITQSVQELEIERQILFAQDRIADLRREQPDNVEEIIKAEKQLGSLKLQLLEQENKSERENFEQEQLQFNEEMNMLLEQRGTLNRNTEEGKRAYNELHQRIMDLADEQRLTTERRNELLLKQDNEITQQRIENINKIADIRKNAEEPVVTAPDDETGMTEEEKMQKRLQAERDLQTQRQEILTNQLRLEQITQAEFDAQNEILLLERLLREKEIMDEFDVNSPEKQLEIAEARLAISRSTNAEILEGTKERIDAETKLQKEAAKLQKMIESEKAQTAIGAANSILDTIKQNSEEGSQAYKAAAIAQVVISSAQGAITAFSQAMTLGPIAGPIVGAALVAGIGVMAAKQIATINSAVPGGGSGGGGGPRISAPSVNTQDATETPQMNLYGSSNEGNEGDASMFNAKNQQPQQIQAWVAWSDIDSVQNQDNAIQQEMQL